MKRYYYDESIAAEWMMKYFRMKWSADSYVRFAPDARLGDKGEACRFYIHPDSLALLEPQEGDILVTADDYPFKIIKMVKTGNCRIIQRGGIPFHWPKQEGI